jgi:transcriptional regulator GlxA family with amidase domain
LPKPCEEIVVINSPEELSGVERDVIAQIKAWRASPEDKVHSSLLQTPAQLMRSVILDKHGSVKLRFSPIAAELGVEMRTLQRAFVEEYEMTMQESQTEARLEFAQFLLRMMPPNKMSVIADLLGYDAVRDFNRFFEKHMHEAPSVWGRAEREKASAKAEQLRDPSSYHSPELL